MNNTLHMRWTLLGILLGIALMMSPSQAVLAADFEASWPYKADLLGARQVVVVKVKTAGAIQGTLSLREKRNGAWTTVLADVPVVLGKNGIGKTREGDGKTPSGVYALGQAFGTAAKPEGFRLPYTRTTAQDYWVDDVASADYNQWIRYSGKPETKWDSFERLHQPLYRYAVVVSYNEQPIVKGKGSAIFLHLWRSPDKPTAGCIAMSERNLLALLERLDPAQSPAIAVGLG